MVYEHFMRIASQYGAMDTNAEQPKSSHRQLWRETHLAVACKSSVLDARENHKWKILRQYSVIAQSVCQSSCDFSFYAYKTKWNTREKTW